ncbi:MAG: Ig-like domain-containing protein [Deltaproteobacteria bacterium]
MPKPLNFISSVPANGATNVSRSLKTITLLFDKNVVDDSVWVNNQRQVQMFLGADRLTKGVDYRVTRSTALSQRRKIFIKLLHRLLPNTKYKVVVKPGLTSKAGEQLGSTVIITFTTGSSGSISGGGIVHE